jgi:mRNA interferase MazF
MKVDRFKRGQIWWLRDIKEYDGSVQGGSRPVIIISNDYNNRFSNNLTVIPCTSQVKKDLPTHIKFEINGLSTVLAENIKTVNQDRIGNYIGTCDNELICKIDEIIKVALGLKTIIQAEKVEITKEDIEPTSKCIDNNKLSDKISTRESYNGIGRKGYRKYTKEQMMQFVEEFEKIGAEKMMKKYNCVSEKAVANKLYRFRKFLKEDKK